MKNKYENFCNYLKNSGKQTLTLTVEDIEKINNDYLPTKRIRLSGQTTDNSGLKPDMI